MRRNRPFCREMPGSKETNLMKKKGRKDKIGYKNKQRKRQIENAKNEIAGVDEETTKRLKQKILENTGYEGLVIRNNQLEKMSEIILDYAEPLMNAVNTDKKEDVEKVILMAITYWNCAILAESSKNLKEIEKLMKPLLVNVDGLEVSNYMMNRKRQLYPDNKRMIISYDIADQAGGGFHVSVASSINDEIAEKYKKGQ